MKKILLLIVFVLLSGCGNENEKAIECIKNNTCNLNSNNEWEEVDDNVYTLEIQGVNFDRYVYTVDFNEKDIQLVMYNNDIEDNTIRYDWLNNKGYYIYKIKGTIAIDGKNHMKILEETTYENHEKLKSSFVWDDIKEAVISPFRDTPLYPLNLK